ncbi:MAG: hypothetical protein K8823_178 [Cenarchaeum symbiont of Oopsacas minuta]|nr:hypothetical protein [Cenarchaeum symbiont of Oopsacas minuta]
MQYFQAVQQGRQRAAKSQMKLFDIAGFAMLTLTTKKVNDIFVPVGEEDYVALIQTRDGYVTILADGDGKTKAQTKALEKNIAADIFNKVIESGVPKFNGDQVEIWTEKYPIIQV